MLDLDLDQYTFIHQIKKLEKMKFLCQILLFIVIALNINLNFSKPLPANDESNADVSTVFNNWIEQKQSVQSNTDKQYSICKEIKTYYDNGTKLIRNLIKGIRKVIK